MSAERRVGFDWAAAAGSDRPMPVRMVLRLQQTIGNREVTALLTQPPAAIESRAPRFVPGARVVGRLIRAARRLRGSTSSR